MTVTDYVNPLQFGPDRGSRRLPPRPRRDCELAGEAGADLGVRPDHRGPLAGARPAPASRVEGLTDDLEGASRPGHFDGVATIVAKLLSLAGPCWAYFGEKDFQQLAVIRRLVADLSLPVEVIGCPTVRDPDGLALSSRNAYLTDGGAGQAPRSSTTPCSPASGPSRRTGSPTRRVARSDGGGPGAPAPVRASTTRRWPTRSS